MKRSREAIEHPPAGADSPRVESEVCVGRSDAGEVIEELCRATSPQVKITPRADKGK